VGIFTGDEALSTERAAERLELLRSEQETAAARGREIFRARSALQREAGTLRARIWRFEQHFGQATAIRRAEEPVAFRVASPLGEVEFTEVPAHIPVLRDRLARLDERITEMDREHRAILASEVALRQEADLVAARQKERFRTDALASPGGGLLPPRIVR
jgi:hypothetical protein